jgi:hypothetical protein
LQNRRSSQPDPASPAGDSNDLLSNRRAFHRSALLLVPVKA